MTAPELTTHRGSTVVALQTARSDTFENAMLGNGAATNGLASPRIVEFPSTPDQTTPLLSGIELEANYLQDDYIEPPRPRVGPGTRVGAPPRRGPVVRPPHVGQRRLISAGTNGPEEVFNQGAESGPDRNLSLQEIEERERRRRGAD